MIYFIVFLSGAILMSLEMVGSRILAPTFGSSIYVWGSLIVTVMTALTIGYYAGGKSADKFSGFLPMSIILTLTGLLIGFLPFYTYPVNQFCSNLDIRTGPLLASFIFFFLPGLLLASISPYGIKISSQSLDNIGKTAGRMAAVSSAGSIFGTLITSFFLIPTIGVRNIVHILGLILFLLSLIIVIKFMIEKKSIKIIKINLLILFIIISILILSFFWVSILLPSKLHAFGEYKILFDKDTMYHHITVDEQNEMRHLHFDESYQSAINLDDPMNMVFKYTSYAHLGAVVKPDFKNVLFIGLGGGLIPTKFLNDYPQIQSIDTVEIDPEVVYAAKKYFMLPENSKLNNITMDGRLFVEKAYQEIKQNKRKPYDMIIIDAYYATSIPFHLTTKEFLESVKKITSSDGVVVSNIIGAFEGKSSRLLKAMSKTFNSVYPQIYLFPVDGWNDKNDFSETNVILIATMNDQKIDKYMWQEKADQNIKKGIFKENINEFVKMLVDEEFLNKDEWFKEAPLLTDDYAPIDTYQNFL